MIMLEPLPDPEVMGFGPLDVAACGVVGYIFMMGSEIPYLLWRVPQYIKYRVYGEALESPEDSKPPISATNGKSAEPPAYKKTDRRASIPHEWNDQIIQEEIITPSQTAHVASAYPPRRQQFNKDENNIPQDLEGAIEAQIINFSKSAPPKPNLPSGYPKEVQEEIQVTQVNSAYSQLPRGGPLPPRTEAASFSETQTSSTSNNSATLVWPSAHPSLRVPVVGPTITELIFSGEYTKAMEQDFHSGHFCCWNCDLSLTGHRYILKDDHPFCIKCYENLFANVCEECKKPIGTDSKDLSYKDKHWHEACFKCCDCQRSLVDQPFASKDEKLYCADCYDNNFAARCDGCGGIFRAGMKKFEFRGKQWHEECFCCAVCKQAIGNQRFIPRDTEYVCVPCYEDQFAQRCLKCNGVINKGGITYKSHPFHRDCFTCTNCNKILAGEKFTSREDAPYCADCFGDLFAKKCCRCSRPITGLGGTKFISFDDRHWHSDCFGCYRCNASLVGRGFLTNEQDILCPECGKTL